jgi:hypothetical protein
MCLTIYGFIYAYHTHTSYEYKPPSHETDRSVVKSCFIRCDLFRSIRPKIERAGRLLFFGFIHPLPVHPQGIKCPRLRLSTCEKEKKFHQLKMSVWNGRRRGSWNIHNRAVIHIHIHNRLGTHLSKQHTKHHINTPTKTAIINQRKAHPIKVTSSPPLLSSVPIHLIIHPPSSIHIKQPVI